MIRPWFSLSRSTQFNRNNAVFSVLLAIISGCNSDPGSAHSKSAHTQVVSSDVNKNPDATMSPQQEADPAEAMRQLRLRALTTNTVEFGIQATASFPTVYGALAEFPLEDGTITIVALSDGTASLYTTFTFGIIGGQSHESVRTAAVAFVNAAQALHDSAVPTTDFPYPKSGRVRFYLLTFSGIRVIDTDLASAEAGSNPNSDLFQRANDVFTELRLTVEKQSGG